MKNSIKRAQSQACLGFAERKNFRPLAKLKKLSLTLAALITAATGAWAQTDEVTVTPASGQTNQWTFTMPAGNVELTPIYAPELTATFKAGNANTIQSGKATVTVTESGATEGTDVTANIGSDNKLTPLYEGQTITLTAKPGYKFRSVTAKKRPEFVPGATIQNIESFVEVENNRDGTITLHMPTLNPSTYNVTNSTVSNGEHTLHFGYEMGSFTGMSIIGANIITKSWSNHTPFSELDKTIDITSGEKYVYVIIAGHQVSATCPAPNDEHFWGMYCYTNPVKVTYDLGGGSISGSTADKVEYLFSGDALATTFAAPTREGYTFDGWYTSAEGGTKLTASNATSATTIYAHWNAIAE